MTKKTAKQIQAAVRKIDRIEVCGTGCMPQAEHHQIADEALQHLHTITGQDVQSAWQGWTQCELTDDGIICHIATARACEIVAKKHRWDMNYCFEAISYWPVDKYGERVEDVS